MCMITAKLDLTAKVERDAVVHDLAETRWNFAAA